VGAWCSVDPRYATANRRPAAPLAAAAPAQPPARAGAGAAAGAGAGKKGQK
jgi:hypothetical protein